MAGCDTQETIEAKLHSFLQDKKSPWPKSPRPSEKDGPYIVLHGQAGPELNHPIIKEMEAVGGKGTKFEECKTLLRGDLHHRVLFQVTIHNSNLDNCTIIECNIYQCNIKRSLLVDCRIQKEALGGNDASSAPYLTDCQIEDGTVYDAYIYGSTVNGTSMIKSCYIKDSLVVDCRADDSTIIHCGVHGSELRNCEVVNPDIFDPKEVVQVSGVMKFRNFPVEIRKMIYSDAITNEGLTTNLIAAFRPDSLLYNEVLQTLFQEHVFILSEKNQQATNLPKSVTKRVTKLYLDMNGKGLPTNDISIYFPSDTKIRDIGMKLEGSPADIDHFYNVAKLWFKYLGTVTKFTVDWPNTGPWVSGNPPARLLGCIKVANKWLKTEGVLIRGKVQVKNPGVWMASGDDISAVPPSDWKLPEELVVETFTWTWTATKGHALLWDS